MYAFDATQGFEMPQVEYSGTTSAYFDSTSGFKTVENNKKNNI